MGREHFRDTVQKADKERNHPKSPKKLCFFEQKNTSLPTNQMERINQEESI